MLRGMFFVLEIPCSLELMSCYACVGFVIYLNKRLYYSFVLDPTIGEFVMTQKQMKIPGPYVQYSVNESYSPTWDPRVKKFVDDKKVERDNPIPQRYDL